jgi:hypothetical protein
LWLVGWQTGWWAGYERAREEHAALDAQDEAA